MAFPLPTHLLEGLANTKVKSLTYDEYLQKRVDDYNASVGTKTGCNCSICKNKGYLQRLKDGYIVNTPCECTKARESINKMHKSGISELLIDCTFAKYDDTEQWRKTIKSKAIEYTKDKNGSWFFIGGQTGAGKTHICTAICGQLLKQNIAVKYMIWTTEIRTLKSIVNDAQAYKAQFDDFANAQVLYIDDLFKTTDIKPADIQHTFDIINYRYFKKLRTIISSEKEMSQIRQIDGAIHGRIYQSASDYLIGIGQDEKRNWRLRQ